MTTNIKIRDATRDELGVVEELEMEACKEFRYSELKADAKAWKTELAEREEWDAAIDDGVEED